MRDVWEALEPDGEGVVTHWRLQVEQRAKLDAKLDMLRAAEVDELTRQAHLPPNLLAGPGINGQKWIYKLKIKGRVALRPMLCLGPVETRGEWTISLGLLSAICN